MALPGKIDEILVVKIFEIVQNELEKDLKSDNEPSILFLQPLSTDFIRTVPIKQDVLSKVTICSIEQLNSLIEQKKKFKCAYFCNSLLSSPAYKEILIALHKILKDNGEIVTFDFFLKDEVSYTHTEVQSLSDKLDYKTAIMKLELFKGKCQKYCFEQKSSEDLSNQLIVRIEDHNMQKILNGERLLFLKTICVKKKGDKSQLEPRLRDENGFRRRAAAIIVRKTETDVEILLLKRRSNGWTVPGGGVEKDEEIDKAVLRESFEETGVIGEVLKYFECLTDKVRKTKTEVFLVKCLEEKDKYPEDSREKKWFSRSFLNEKYKDKTDFFGKGSVTTKGMLSLTWEMIEKM